MLTAGFWSRDAMPARRNPLDRHLAALQLRQAGYTFAQIAKRLGYASGASAWYAVQAGLRATVHERADELRRHELQRLDAVQQALWPRAIRGDLHALDGV